MKTTTVDLKRSYECMSLYKVFWVLINKNLQVPKILPNSFNAKDACISSISSMLRAYPHTASAVTPGDCSNVLKHVRYSCYREVPPQVPSAVWISHSGHKNPCTGLSLLNTNIHYITCPHAPTSPVQAGQQDSDLSVACFLACSSK